MFFTNKAEELLIDVTIWSRPSKEDVKCLKGFQKKVTIFGDPGSLQEPDI